MKKIIILFILPLFFSCILNNNKSDSYVIRFLCDGLPKTGSMSIVGNSYEYENYKIGMANDGSKYLYFEITEEIYKNLLSINISAAKAEKIYIDIIKNGKIILIVADEVVYAGAHTYKINKM